MKNLDRKSIFIGLLIPITAIIFMGAVKNVLSRYHTIQAEEFQLVDGEGNAIFNLSEMLTADINNKEELTVDYGPMIANLKSEIQSMNKKIEDLNTKLNETLLMIDSKKSGSPWPEEQMDLCVSQGAIDFGMDVSECVCIALEKTYPDYSTVEAIFASANPNMDDIQTVLSIFIGCGATFPE